VQAEKEKGENSQEEPGCLREKDTTLGKKNPRTSKNPGPPTRKGGKKKRDEEGGKESEADIYEERKSFQDRP